MRRLLGPEEIHVWNASLDGQAAPMTVLDEAERRRAGSFTLARPRADFIQGRTILRRILASYLARDPASLGFSLGPHGKPALANGEKLRFNASHSGACLVIAVRQDWCIGVDVERRREMANAGAIARRFFTAREADQIEALAPTRQADGFRALWTLKEAIVKAVGEQLAPHLNRLEATLDPDGMARFVAWHGMGRVRQAWWVSPFCPAPGYSATLATRAATPAPNIVYFDNLSSFPG